MKLKPNLYCILLSLFFLVLSCTKKQETSPLDTTPIASDGSKVVTANVTLVGLTLLPASATIPKGVAHTIQVIGIYSDGTQGALPASSSQVNWSFSSRVLPSPDAANGVLGIQNGSGKITVQPIFDSFKSDESNVVTITVKGKFCEKCAEIVTYGSISVIPAQISKLTIRPINAVSSNISNTAPNINIGTSQKFVAIGELSDSINGSDVLDLTSSVTWSVQEANANVSVNYGLVSVSGIAKAGTSVNILASISGIAAKTLVTIGGAIPKSLVIKFENMNLVTGNKYTLTAQIVNTDDSTSDATDVTWSSNAPSIASFSADAAGGGQTPSLSTATSEISLYTHNLAGNVNIVAKVKGATELSASVVFNVTLEGDKKNSKLDEIKIAGPGSAIAPDGKTYINGPIVSVPSGTQMQLFAIAKYAVGEDVSYQDVSTTAQWIVTSANARISNTGVFSTTADATSEIKVRAKYAGKDTPEITIQVSKPLITSVQFEPPFAILAAGMKQEFTVKVYYSDGKSENISKDPQVTWSTSDTNVKAAIATAPNIFSLSETLETTVTGTTFIQATYGDNHGNKVTGSAALTFIPAQIESLSIDPSNANGALSIPVGGTQQFIATATMSDKTKMNVTNNVEWPSNYSRTTCITPCVTLSNNGLLKINSTALQNDSVGIWANLRSNVSTSKQTKSNMTVMSISAPVPTALLVKPSIPIVQKDKTIIPEASFLMPDGSQIPTGSVTWKTEDSSGAVSVESGKLTGNILGTAQVSATASFGNKSYTTPFSVIVYSSDTALTGINISLDLDHSFQSLATLGSGSSPRASLPAGTQLQLQAVGTYNDKTKKTITNNVDWLLECPSTIPKCGFISNTGLFTAGLYNSSPSNIVTVKAGIAATTNTFTIEILPPRLESVDINPKFQNLVVPISKTDIAFSAIGTFSDGTKTKPEFTVSDADYEVTWKATAYDGNGPRVNFADNKNVLKIDTTTKGYAGQVGTSLITVSVKPKSLLVASTATSTVTSIEGTTSFSVMPENIKNVQISVVGDSCTLNSCTLNSGSQHIPLSAKATYSNNSSIDVSSAANWSVVDISSSPVTPTSPPTGGTTSPAGGTTSPAGGTTSPAGSTTSPAGGSSSSSTATGTTSPAGGSSSSSTATGTTSQSCKNGTTFSSGSLLNIYRSCGAGTIIKISVEIFGVVSDPYLITLK